MRHPDRPQGALWPLSAEDCGSEEAAASIIIIRPERDSSDRTCSWAESRSSAVKCLNSGRDGTRRPDEPGGGCSRPGQLPSAGNKHPEPATHRAGTRADGGYLPLLPNSVQKSFLFMELCTRLILYINQYSLIVNSAYGLLIQTAPCSGKESFSVTLAADLVEYSGGGRLWV